MPDPIKGSFFLLKAPEKQNEGEVHQRAHQLYCSQPIHANQWNTQRKLVVRTRG